MTSAFIMNYYSQTKIIKSRHFIIFDNYNIPDVVLMSKVIVGCSNPNSKYFMHISDDNKFINEFCSKTLYRNERGM